ncbi:MAG: hypothetical protein PHE53_13635 [Thermoguttaceae bacterium]|nr:hypothetical protein [Thermoguttaceae bacterium]
MDRRNFLQNLSLGLFSGLAVSSVVGCRGVERPTLFSRKSLKEQQREAEYFDPFPLPESGPNPPGLRYKGMEVPAPEPVRATQDPTNAYIATPVPSVPTAIE